MAVVIADAGPLMAFAKIKKLDLLQQLFSEVLLTESVKKEVLTSQSNDALLIKEAINNGCLKCVADPKLETIVSRSLGGVGKKQ